ncbi:MAG: NUDIX domain-containing protein [Theionarchaea archaeon]|nr:NUDIX domain-containing protein [Theionarchaea archaeon]
MREESCGAVIYNGKEYLLLHYDAGHWDFPKGNREEGETSKEAAVREIEEETGIIELKFDDFEKKIHYVYRRGKDTIFKTVIYFLADSKEKKVVLSWEHQGFEWLSYENALDRLTYENAREVLTAAHTYRKQLYQVKLDSFRSE